MRVRACVCTCAHARARVRTCVGGDHYMTDGTDQHSARVVKLSASGRLIDTVGP